MFLAGK
ncbi:hypothetical protein E2320_020048, partial [Naja naja]